MRFHIGDLVYYKNRDGYKVPAEVVGYHTETGGKLYYIINLGAGILATVSGDSLEYMEEESDDEDGAGQNASLFKFEIDDIVRVEGYPEFHFVVYEQMRVIFEGERENIYILFPKGQEPSLWNMVEAFEDEMELVSRGPKEFKPKDKRIERVESAEKPHKERRQMTEKEVLEELRRNREAVEDIKAHIDRKLALYSVTKDRKYLRHAKRLKQWADKIPTRAHEIE